MFNLTFSVKERELTVERHKQRRRAYGADPVCEQDPCAYCFRANMAHLRQTRPNFDLGFQLEVLQIF